MPGRTGVNVEPKTLARLATIPNVVGVKEASGNMGQICEVCRNAPEHFIVLSGDDSLTLPVMSVGGRGIISVAAERRSGGDGEDGRTRRGQRLRGGATHPRDADAVPDGELDEANPIPIKSAMAMMGLLDERHWLPMVPPLDASKEKIAAVLEQLRGTAAR